MTRSAAAALTIVVSAFTLLSGATGAVAHAERHSFYPDHTKG